jgi:hypothetical protein
MSLVAAALVATVELSDRNNRLAASNSAFS